ncbi:hypothetical protein HYC85_003356 [Camellia sinensis]|uniref:Uncharacterized protein n=1 Tax=Camellia sinensis TaxID=4442 RepID=A0A7J7IC51_CAMSI|nr:hypothetical protein HYC85_003356 [Camellia sinensis]
MCIYEIPLNSCGIRDFRSRRVLDLCWHVECTVSVIQALVSFLHLGYREKEIEISVAKAISFLEQKQWPMVLGEFISLLNEELWQMELMCTMIWAGMAIGEFASSMAHFLR